MTERRRFRWYQFSLRSMLGLMLLCAVWMLWWARYITPLREQQRVTALVAKLHGTVHTRPAAWGWVNKWFGGEPLSHIEIIELTKTRVADRDLRGIGNLPRLRGLHVSQTRIGDDGLSHLTGLPALARLNLDMTRVTDAGVRELGKLSNLDTLSLINTQITDRGLETIGQLRHLERLDLRGTKITDVGLRHLSKQKSLEDLCLARTGITDAGLEHLANLTSLHSLDLSGTEVTVASMPLLARLPNLLTVDVEGTRILPAAFRRQFPALAHEALERELDKPTTIDIADASYADLIERLRNFRPLAILPSRRTAVILTSDECPPFAATMQDKALRSVLEELFLPRGMRPTVRYGCVQIIAADEAVEQPCRMVVEHPLAVSQSLSQRLYRGCPPMDGLYRNQLLATSQPAHIVAMIPRYYTWRLEDLTAAMKDLGLKTECDEAAFTDHPELLSRQIVVPTRWRASLSAALESMFDLLDVHGVIKDDTIWIRPGAAPE